MVARRIKVVAFAICGSAYVSACSLATLDADVPGAPLGPLDAGRDAAPPARVEASAPPKGPCATPTRDGKLVINEVAAAEDPDWFELWNGSEATIDLGGYAVYDKVDAKTAFPPGTSIAPGEYLVFETGSASAPFPFGLSSTNGDSLVLVGPTGEVVDETAFPGGMLRGGSWTRVPDGDPEGTFVLVNEGTRGACNGSQDDTLADAGAGGDGGADATHDAFAESGGDADANAAQGDAAADGSDSPTCALPRLDGKLVVNEVVSNTSPDRFELFNGTLFVIDLARLRAYDSAGPSVLAPFPPGSTIEPGAYATFTTGNGGDFPWGLGASGDAITVVNESGSVVDSVAFGALEAGKSWARSKDGEGPLTLASSPTLGTCNAGATDGGRLSD